MQARGGGAPQEMIIKPPPATNLNAVLGWSLSMRLGVGLMQVVHVQ